MCLAEALGPIGPRSIPGGWSLQNARPVSLLAIPAAAPPTGGLPTRRVVMVDEPHPLVELVTIVATRNRVRPRRPVPLRARNIGPWRSVTDNSGRSRKTLSCAIGVGSRLGGVPGRAFQARDRWGHIGATFGPRTTGPQRTTTVTSGPSSASSATKVGQASQVARISRGSLTQKSATVVPPRHMPTRQHSSAMALRGQEETAGLEKARQRPGRNVHDRFEVLQPGVSAPTREASPSAP